MAKCAGTKLLLNVLCLTVVVHMVSLHSLESESFTVTKMINETHSKKVGVRVFMKNMI